MPSGAAGAQGAARIQTGFAEQCSRSQGLSKSVYRVLQGLLLAAAAAMLALHFLHLSADFPNNSRWSDWAKYTDEGWYGDAAIRYFQLGHWYLPGAFNPAVALPIWPLLEALVFRITGVSLVAARALSVSIFALTIVVAYIVVRQSARRAEPAWHEEAPWRADLIASSAVLVLAVNPFCFVFSRLAILEPLMVLLAVLALLAASMAVPLADIDSPYGRRDVGVIVSLGVLLPAMVLTKTTAIALLPAVFWMLFARLEYRVRPLLKVGGAAALLAVGLWCAYFFGVVNPRYLRDYQYLFDANRYTSLASGEFGAVLSKTVERGLAIGSTLYIAGCICAGLALVMLPRLRRHPLVASLLLWIAGYAAFLVYHNSAQPRYYYVLTIPLVLLIAVVVGSMLLPLAEMRKPPVRAASFAAAAALLVGIAGPEALRTLHFMSHPEYTYLRAAGEIRATIDAAERKDPAHSRLVLSISGSDLSLMTGLPSICDDFGTLELSDEIKLYKPGWYVAWNDMEDDKMEALSPMYRIVRVASFPALDDPERNLMILYRLDLRLPAGTRPLPRTRGAAQTP